MNAVRLRFAPSPTGFLHVGGARTALFNWLLARHRGGAFLLRIEDTDRQRSTQAYTDAILDAMTWLGLDWDEGPGIGGPHGPYYQMERLDRYHEAADRLLSGGRAYPCFCPPRAEAEATEDLEPETPVRADCRCAEMDPAERQRRVAEGPHAVRFATPKDGEIELEDLIHGSVRFERKEIVDFIILKADGVPTYNFACVVDDAAMCITHVIRGDDHLSNTPKQVLLYEALGLDLPRFGHIPMILGPDKKRLSKRHGAVSLQQFREDGYLPEALVNYIARLGWAHGDEEIFGRQELIAAFDLDGVGKSACVFDYAKLEWLNGEWIRRLGAAEMARRVRPLWEGRGWIGPDESGERLEGIASTLVERARTLVELADKARFYFDVPFPWDGEARAKFLTDSNRPILAALAERLGALREWSHDAIEAAFRQLAADRGVKPGAVIQPVRVALTGSTVSPGMFEVVQWLGRERTLARLEEAIVAIADSART